MLRRAARSSLVLLTLGGEACKYEPVDAVVSRADTGLDPGPDAAGVCIHAAPPSKPVVASSADADAGDLVYVVRQLDTGDTDDSTGTHRFRQIGFDLDQTCTSGITTSSCREPSWATMDNTDGPDGRDNAIGLSLYSAQTTIGFSATTSANNDAESGTLSMIIRVRGYNGSAYDDAVEADYYVGSFHPQPGRPQPMWDGQDAWDANYMWVKGTALPDGGTAYDVDQPLYADTQSYVSSSYLVSHLDSLFNGAARFHLLKAVISLRLAPPGGVRLDNGTIAGRVRMDEVLAGLAAFPDPARSGKPLCTDSPYYPGAKAQSCSYADISATGPDDGKSICDAASWAWRIVNAQPAKLLGVSLQPPATFCPDATSPANDHCDTLR